jgi:DNA-binding winged helix-turn-helix (wHTH) protein
MTLTITDWSRLPTTFRQRTIGRVIQCVENGECCAIVGVGSVGKSNVLRHLTREDVLAHHLKDKAQKFLFVNVDGNAMVERSVWGYYELMFNRLILAAEAQLGSEWRARFDPLYQQVMDSTNPRLARRYLERLVRDLRNTPEKHRIVFLMDEFDDVFSEIEGDLFAGLRALRDDHKYKLVYVIFGRKELSQTHLITGNHEAFYELFPSNTFGLGPYTEQDARFMIGRLAARREKPISRDATTTIINVTSAHPGLIRITTFAVLDDEINLQGGDLRTQLLTNHKVRDEFRKIWEGLNPDEQTALFEISKNNPDVNRYALEMLQLKKVVESSNPPRIFNDIFATYVRDDAKIPRFSIDWGSQSVWRGSERVTGITKREYELLAHLYKNHNRVCAVDELVREVLKDDPLSVTQQKIQSLVNRARRKIELDLRKPVYLVRHGDEGYRLENC